jgi:hypothetical protein
MESPTFPQRYGQIEEAYRQQEWSTVMEQGQSLLADLEKQPEAAAGVKPRLQLLMAHTLLYGYNNSLVAEDFYTRVAAVNSESDLQPIAEEGINNCRTNRAERQENEARAQAEAEARANAEAEAQQRRKAAQEELISARDNQSQPTSPVPGAGSPGPVMPWLVQTEVQKESVDSAATAPTQTACHSALVSQERAPVGETLIPEIVDEPELLELHQAESSLAEEVDLMVRDRLGVGLAELGDRNRHSIESVALAEQAELAEQAQEAARIVAQAEGEDEDLMAGLLRVVLS